jgi:hypothetical protein
MTTPIAMATGTIPGPTIPPAAATNGAMRRYEDAELRAMVTGKPMYQAGVSSAAAAVNASACVRFSGAPGVTAACAVGTALAAREFDVVGSESDADAVATVSITDAANVASRRTTGLTCTSLGRVAPKPAATMAAETPTAQTMCSPFRARVIPVDVPSTVVTQRPSPEKIIS